MKTLLVSKLKESIISVVPIVVIVVILSFILGFDIDFVFKFIFSSIFLIIGLALFTLGADLSMIEIGQRIGGYLAKKNWIWFTIITTLFVGVIITIAEPDLIVLANQVKESISSTLLIMAVALGVGIYMVISIVRTKYSLPLNIILLVSYLTVFVLAFFLPDNFFPLALDSGSVTTGPISVPFIMAFGIGLATVSSVKGKSSDDSFGTVGLVSVGPILAVMLLGIILHTNDLNYVYSSPEEVKGFFNIIAQFFVGLPHECLNIIIVILPIFLFFIIFQIFALKLPLKTIFQIFLGIVYVFVGISLFLNAVNYAFLTTGQSLGLALANMQNNWLIIPLFCIIGLVIVLAEPAVHVLAKQIEVVTSGVVSKKMMFVSLCVGVSLALGLVATRILFSINVLYIIIPIFTICFILTFLTPKMFTGIAFDSGGVVTGAMSTTFVLPMIIGIVCVLSGEISILKDAFGSLAIVASSPILLVLIVGFIYKVKSRRNEYKIKTKRAIVVEFE